MAVTTWTSLWVGDCPNQLNFECYYWYSHNHPCVPPVGIWYHRTKFNKFTITFSIIHLTNRTCPNMGGYTIFFLNPKQWISCFSDSMQLSISSKIYWPQKSSLWTYFNLVANNISKIHYIWKFDAFLGICALTLKIWSLRNIWVIIFYVISQILYLFISIWKFHKFLRFYFSLLYPNIHGFLVI